MDDDDRPSETEYGLIEPFDIDDGSLQGIAAGECFSLGVEWAMFRVRLKTGKPFTTYCLANNAERLNKMAERHRRYVEYCPATTPGWALITVGGYLV